MWAFKGVVVMMLDAGFFEKLMGFCGLLAPVLLTGKDQSGLFLEETALFRDQKIGSVAGELFRRSVNGFHPIVERCEREWRIPCGGVAEELRILENQAECSPTTLAESQEEPSLRRAQSRIILPNEW